MRRNGDAITTPTGHLFPTDSQSGACNLIAMDHNRAVGERLAQWHCQPFGGYGGPFRKGVGVKADTLLRIKPPMIWCKHASMKAKSGMESWRW